MFFIMVVIFLFSAQNGENSSDTSSGFLALIQNSKFLSLFFPPIFSENQSANIRTFAHLYIFMILGFTSAIAVRFYIIKRYTIIRHFILSLTISVLYAISDEIHQYFVPDRAMQIYDVMIDSIGIIIGIIAYFVVYYLISYIKYKFQLKKQI